MRTTRSRSRARGIDASTVMLTGDPVRMYLKEIGKVDLLTAAEEVDLAMKIEAGLDAADKLEKQEAGELELTRAEMRRLMRVEQVGLDAKQALISANLRLVVSIAKRYVGRGMLFLDLIQEGNLGLIRAVEKLSLIHICQVDGSELCLFLRESEPGVVRGNLRSKGKLDISGIAVELGGGGRCV